MSVKQLSVRLMLGIAIAGGTIAAETLPGEAQEKLRDPDSLGSLRRDRPATTVKEWLAQVEAATVQVTNVRVDRTADGLDITLETAEGKPLQVDATKFRSEGNSLVADIPNAVLALPQGQAFVAENPATDIARVEVVQQDASRIRVSVTGNNALPQTEVTLRTGNLAYSLNPEADEPDEEIVVTGEREGGYRVPNASTATRTDTPIRDIPQSIQVVPQQVLEDQQAIRLDDALRNVSGITPSLGGVGASASFVIRGFQTGEGSFLRNGLRDSLGEFASENPSLERVEVLRGPASVLYGYGNPGGTINLVTRQPLQTPFYSAEATIGNYDFYRGTIDLTGPLNDSKTILYRLNAAYRDSGSFVDFVDNDFLSVLPVLSFAIGERTRLTIEGEYTDRTDGYYVGVPVNIDLPRSRNLSEPSADVEQTTRRVGYRLEHQLSDNWVLRNALGVKIYSYRDDITLLTGLRTDNRTFDRRFRNFDYGNYDEYVVTTDLIGEFATGSIEHQLLFGVDLSRFSIAIAIEGGTATPIDLFNPEYGLPRGSASPILNLNRIRDSLGIFVQDQVTLAENLKLLLGGRFDLFEERGRNFLTDTSTEQSAGAFSPRLGIVYQPIPPISLYASYARSFTPAIGVAFNGDLFEPERSTQYEIGVKAELNNQLSATLALYDLTRSNILTADLNNPGFSIQTGRQRSRGIEFDIAGEILPGWNIIAGYAYTDARITEDERFEVDNFLRNVPEHAFNIWSTYRIQKGDLQGLGFGLGLFFVGARQGNLANSYELPSYFRTDAAIFYERDRFRAALNVRNLFDVKYFESPAFFERGGFYGAPFTVQGTIAWEF
ncbi:MAG: TonB-dependent siderophore receptor [Goleter apudmare HA4340-LM2]|jgi:iron complex outermembrane receptor protein|nr:TonB-dependent siderophore receptor [Goleter apudmare HA4340-LM2]